MLNLNQWPHPLNEDEIETQIKVFNHKALTLTLTISKGTWWKSLLRTQQLLLKNKKTIDDLSLKRLKILSECIQSINLSALIQIQIRLSESSWFKRSMKRISIFKILHKRPHFKKQDYEMKWLVLKISYDDWEIENANLKLSIVILKSSLTQNKVFEKQKTLPKHKLFELLMLIWKITSIDFSRVFRKVLLKMIRAEDSWMNSTQNTIELNKSLMNISHKLNRREIK